MPSRVSNNSYQDNGNPNGTIPFLNSEKIF